MFLSFFPLLLVFPAVKWGFSICSLITPEQKFHPSAVKMIKLNTNANNIRVFSGDTETYLNVSCTHDLHVIFARYIMNYARLVKNC